MQLDAGKRAKAYNTLRCGLFLALQGPPPQICHLSWRAYTPDLRWVHAVNTHVLARFLLQSTPGDLPFSPAFFSNRRVLVLGDVQLPAYGANTHACTLPAPPAVAG